MRIEFILREPGNHHRVGTEEASAVPREGEAVALDPDDAALTVHSVTYVVENGELIAHVLLRA